VAPAQWDGARGAVLEVTVTVAAGRRWVQVGVAAAARRRAGWETNYVTVNAPSGLGRLAQAGLNRLRVTI
jgi:hypothetical protein